MNRKDEALLALEHSAILVNLSQYSPTVVSTLWVGMDIEGSDIDVICCYQKKKQFIEDLESSCQQFKKFQITDMDDRVIASFNQDGFCIEIFATDQPV
ncbi:MAG: DUF4269 domain-containing protein, partial [Pseudomonadales bacterium]|nr:DUF4269 domain-containing protein [Pseudomonadales bacterium]